MWSRRQQSTASRLGGARGQVTPVTCADFAAWVTTSDVELPVTCGHGGWKVAPRLHSAGGPVVAGLRLRARMVTPASAVHFVHEMTSFWPSGGLIVVISCVKCRPVRKAVRKDELAAARRGLAEEDFGFGVAVDGDQLEL